MSPNLNTENFLSWKAFLTSMLSLITIAITTGAWAWSTHVSQPHPGVVGVDEYARHVLSTDQRLIRIENKLDTLLGRK